MPFLKKKIIYGCESRGDAQSPYLSRWTLLSTKLGAVYLHLFHRSDADEMHDHPWSFISVVLWRGYVEETPSPGLEWRTVSVAEGEDLIASGEGWTFGAYFIGDTMHVFRSVGRDRKRVWPGMVLLRPASWVHRVELIDEKPAITLIIRGPYVRQWGFWTRNGWQFWRDYFTERGC